MRGKVRIELEPLGQSFDVEPGTPLQDVLFPYGVEFPCGGRGRCKRCRVRILEGELDATAEQRSILTAEDLAAGWRLACHSKVEGPLKLDIAQWETTILTDDTAFEFTPASGLGIAVDLGTTTLVAQLLDLTTGHVLAVRTALNPQVVHGADVMSRVELSISGGAAKLRDLIREEIGRLVADLVAGATAASGGASTVAIVGNTVMHHLFCGIGLEPLSHAPFEAVRDGLEVFRASDLSWRLPGDPEVRFLPCLGSFVGSDVLAGILATRLYQSEQPVVLIDLGTNGEIVIGNRERILCASTAAGPAFEGGKISMGMRAATGAITQVTVESRRAHVHVIGGGPPRGICGSGLVDAVAAGLELGVIRPTGRLRDARTPWPLVEPVSLTQSDIRELQLAKAAIAAGLRILLARLGVARSDITRVYLAGAFGNYVNRGSARRIGLLDFPLEIVEPAGNTALLGAKMSLFLADRGEWAHAAIRARTEHLSLAADEHFLDTYVEEMTFPAE
jgi:uncharacterized 2Fe-2S/4Fe-4S cluster protein (DUF4445 family)